MGDHLTKASGSNPPHHLIANTSSGQLFVLDLNSDTRFSCENNADRFCSSDAIFLIRPKTVFSALWKQRPYLILEASEIKASFCQHLYLCNLSDSEGVAIKHLREYAGTLEKLQWCRARYEEVGDFTMVLWERLSSTYKIKPIQSYHLLKMKEEMKKLKQVLAEANIASPQENWNRVRDALWPKDAPSIDYDTIDTSRDMAKRGS